MATSQDVLPGVLIGMERCPATVAEDAIRGAVSEFLERTWLWQEEISVAISQGVSEYPLSPTAGVVDGVISAKTPDGFPISFTTNTESVVFDEIPANIDTVMVQVAIRPVYGSDEFPDFILHKWGDTLVHGARSILFEQHDTAWNNLNMSSYHEKRFRYGISRARGKRLKGYTGKSLTVHPRSLGGSS